MRSLHLRKKTGSVRDEIPVKGTMLEKHRRHCRWQSCKHSSAVKHGSQRLVPGGLDGILTPACSSAGLPASPAQTSSLMHMWVKLPEGLRQATGSLSPSPRCSCREQLEALCAARSQKFTPAPGCWQPPLKGTTPSATSKPLASSSLLASGVSEAVKRMQAEGSTCFQTVPRTHSNSMPIR